MKLIRSITALAGLFVSLLVTSPAIAALYEDVSLVYGEATVINSFQVDQAGEYRFTLTDFAFPDYLRSLGAIITSSTQTMAVLELTDLPPSNPEALIYGGGSNLYGGAFSHHTQRQVTTQLLLDEGTYWVAIDAEAAIDWYSASGGVGMYGVEVIATPLPAGIVLMGSGLLFLARLKRRNISFKA